jgi:hypothetical protein
MPDEITVGPFTYTVSDDRHDVDRASFEEKDQLLGGCHHTSLRIVIEPDQHPAVAAETLLHEVLHCCTQVAGLLDELGERREEQVVRRLAPLLLDVLRRNPDLVAWLTRDLP